MARSDDDNADRGSCGSRSQDRGRRTDHQAGPAQSHAGTMARYARTLQEIDETTNELDNRLSLPARLLTGWRCPAGSRANGRFAGGARAVANH